MSRTYQSQIRQIPLLGPLVDCHLRDHTDALTQTFTILLLSTAPLWLGGLVIYAVNTQNNLTLISALLRTMEHGELFMYGTALLAPMFWVALVDPRGARIFPSKIPHMVLIAVIELIASVFFGLIVAGNAVKPGFTFHLSVVVFWTSLFLLYLGTVYHSNRLPSPHYSYK